MTVTDFWWGAERCSLDRVCLGGGMWGVNFGTTMTLLIDDVMETAVGGVLSMGMRSSLIPDDMMLGVTIGVVILGTLNDGVV
jgi:hypothetical protein